MEKFFVYIRPKDGGFISPFLLAKYIEQNIGPIDAAKNTKDGLLTKLNEQQIAKLNGCNIAGTIMEVIANEKMNTSRGVIFYPPFKYITNQEIIEALSPQGVKDISRILKKGTNTTNEKETTEGRINTGLFTITFSKSKIPINIKICYENVKINPYYPNPIKCQNCHLFGHKKLSCRNNKICGNCGDLFHEDCPNTPKCTNCNENHPAWDNKCPMWKNEKDIIKYAIDYEVPFKEARQRQQTNTNLKTYATTLQSNSEVQSLKEEIKQLKEVINQLKHKTTAATKTPAQNQLNQLRNTLTQQQQQQPQQQKQQPQQQKQPPIMIQKPTYQSNQNPQQPPRKEQTPIYNLDNEDHPDLDAFGASSIPKTPRSPIKNPDTKRHKKEPGSKSN